MHLGPPPLSHCAFGFTFSLNQYVLFRQWELCKSAVGVISVSCSLISCIVSLKDAILDTKMFKAIDYGSQDTECTGHFCCVLLLSLKRAHSTAGAQREECLIQFLSKRSCFFEICVFPSPPLLWLSVSTNASPTAASSLASLQRDD